MTNQCATVAVYGAGGHTGRFVVAELLRRTIPVIAVGRDLSRLPSDVPGKVAAIDDPAALDRAFAGCAVVINCAGPFLDSADPVVRAALRAGCAYLDINAEQASTQATLETFDQPAREAGLAVIPAAGFYGGLADLLASVLAKGDTVDELTTAVALDHWWPTEGTRKTGERNRVARVNVDDGKRVPMALPAASIEWSFAAPHGAQSVVEMPFSEIITISRHLPVRQLRSYLGANALGDVRHAGTPAPTAVDQLGRSAQQFAMDVVAVGANGTRRASARGQDIYAVSAPLVAEAAARILDPSFARSGALTLGEAFDARDFLDALMPDHLTVAFTPV
ncbi:saccharopine dehydrogenase family protein [Tahibacter amnicola]|uniref:Saccharopine dehydrogenase NADP-binding domain-containing protein n=1 Tax=Tahibacter amnicola TaxID=2976241 RepID=A0ABY6B727_9GAMM|nr:saccharopine dehydrogenase NADP-binding domain-containing protein [Tahibacter amnicola]UXI65901.1 saccharopine dehydrogenase NADP-binding domain-containing protein [Tahibacter amnicola]